MTTIPLINIDPLDLATGECLGFLEHFFQRMAIIRTAGQGLGMEDEPTALATFVGGERDLDAELVGLCRFAFADALGIRCVPGINLPAALAVFLAGDLPGLDQRHKKGCFVFIIAVDLALDITNETAQPGTQEFIPTATNIDPFDGRKSSAGEACLPPADHKGNTTMSGGRFSTTEGWSFQALWTSLQLARGTGTKSPIAPSQSAWKLRSNGSILVAVGINRSVHPFELFGMGIAPAIIGALLARRT